MQSHLSSLWCFARRPCLTFLNPIKGNNGDCIPQMFIAGYPIEGWLRGYGKQERSVVCIWLDVFKSSLRVCRRLVCCVTGGVLRSKSRMAPNLTPTDCAASRPRQGSDMTESQQSELQMRRWIPHDTVFLSPLGLCEPSGPSGGGGGTSAPQSLARVFPHKTQNKVSPRTQIFL